MNEKNEITGFGGGIAQLDSAQCHSCRAYTPVVNPRLVYGSTGRHRIKAVCFVCGAQVTRMLSKDVVDATLQRQAASVLPPAA